MVFVMDATKIEQFLTDSGVGFMNRRDLMRTGLASGIFTGYSRFHYGADVAGGAWSPTPTELPPISSLQEPPTSLNEAIAKKQVQAEWLITEPFRVRLSLKNLSARRISIHIEPGTLLVHEKQAWLVGGPTKYVGQFGGQFQVQDFGTESQPSSIPVSSNRSTSIVLPIISLTSTSNEKFTQIKDAHVVSATDWTKDAKVITGLKSLSAIGSSMSVAQGIGWRMVKQLGWEQLSKLAVEGNSFNNFERQSIDRFLGLVDGLGQDQTVESIRNELLKDQLTVLVTGFGPKRANGVKYLTENISESNFMGMPIERTETLPAVSPKSAALRLELHIVDQLKPGAFILESSLASRSGTGGLWMKFAKSRSLLRFDTDIRELMESLETQLAPSVVALKRASAGPMTNRFRLENLSPLTLSSVELMTNLNASDPALLELTGLGVTARGRSIVKIPSNSAKAVRLRFGAI